MTTMAEQKMKIIVTLFGAYGQASDKNRQLIYIQCLKDVPDQLLGKACKKLLLESEFLPSIAKIIEASRNIAGEIDETRRVKTWAEAWEEIEKVMYITPWGGTPVFSTPEIAKAVFSYGWNTLQQSLAADMPTVRAQIRRIYEDVCKRSLQQANNEYVLTGEKESLIQARTSENYSSKPLEDVVLRLKEKHSARQARTMAEAI